MGMPSVDEILASSPLVGLHRVSFSGGDRNVTGVRLAERFAEIDDAPAGSFTVLGRMASGEISGYRLDMALRWAATRGVAAVAAFAAGRWKPAVTALDIAGQAGIALVSVPADADLAAVIRAISGEIGGGADQALGRAGHALDTVLRAARSGASPGELAEQIGQALGLTVVYLPPVPTGDHAPPETGVTVAVPEGETTAGYFIAPDAGGAIGTAATMVLHVAAGAVARNLDAARRTRDLPARSRSEIIAELVLAGPAASGELAARARQLGIQIDGWHVVIRFEADNLDEAEHDEVRRFEMLESAGQAALQGASATGGTWYLCRHARAVMLVRTAASDPGPQAGIRAARAAEVALKAIRARLPALRFRAGVGTAHEGTSGLRASAAEARSALVAARAARKSASVAAHDAVGIRRMLTEWYASETVRASVRDQLAPLEKLGPARADTAIRTLATYLDEQGSVGKTAERLHLHRNAVSNRLRNITELLDADLDDPDQRLALQLACRARLIG
jgi:sugar diacid utilization regulator